MKKKAGSLATLRTTKGTIRMTIKGAICGKSESTNGEMGMRVATVQRDECQKCSTPPSLPLTLPFMR